MSGGAPPALTLVVSTYEWPEALDAVLRALSEQSEAGFDVVVADDGSGAPTRRVVEYWVPVFGERLAHVWQPDAGYRLALARNRGALAARGDYLAFLDGDCVPRRGLVRALRRSARPGWFAAGRRLHLDAELTGRVLTESTPVHRWSVLRFGLRARHRVTGLAALTPLDRRRVGRTRVPEFEPHAGAYGFLLGVSRADFERVNGYDARYEGWGEEDVDMAVRLRRLGLRCGHAGPHATVLHLWHEQRRGEVRPNVPLLRATMEESRVEAAVGLRELAEEA